MSTTPYLSALLCKPSHVLPAHGEPQARPREPVKMAKPSVLDGAGTGSKPQSITKLLLEATLANQKYRAIQEELRAKDALLAALQAKTVELTSVTCEQGRLLNQMKTQLCESEEHNKTITATSSETIASIRDEAKKTEETFVKRAATRQAELDEATRIFAAERLESAALKNSLEQKIHSSELQTTAADAARAQAEGAAQDARAETCALDSVLQAAIAEVAASEDRIAVLQRDMQAAQAACDALNTALQFVQRHDADATVEIKAELASLRSIKKLYDGAQADLRNERTVFRTRVAAIQAQLNAMHSYLDGASAVASGAAMVHSENASSSQQLLVPVDDDASTCSPCSPPCLGEGIMLPSPTADFREGDEFPLHADQMVAIADNLQRSLSSLHTRYALHVTHERAMHSKILRDSLKKESRAAADHTLALRADHNASVALLHSEHAGALEAAQAAHAVQLHQLEEQASAQGRDIIACAQKHDAEQLIFVEDARVKMVVLQSELSAAENRAAIAESSLAAAVQRAALAKEQSECEEKRSDAITLSRADQGDPIAAQADASALPASVQLSLAEAEAHIEALSREASYLRAAAAEGYTLRAENSRLLDTIAGLEVYAADAAAAFAAQVEASRVEQSDAAEAFKSEAEWRSLNGVTRESLRAAEDQVKRLLTNMEHLRAENSALEGLHAEACAASAEVVSRHETDLQEALAAAASARDVATAGMTSLHAAEAASAAATSAATSALTEVGEWKRCVTSLEQRLESSRLNELVLRRQLAAAALAATEALAAQGAAAAAASADAKAAFDRSLGCAAVEAVRLMGAAQASHAEQVKTLSLRCAGAEVAADELARGLEATRQAGAGAEAACRALQAQLAVACETAAAVAAASVHEHAGIRADLSTARHLSTRLQADLNDARRVAQQAGQQLAEEQARASEAAAQARAARRRSLAAEASAQASSEALSEAVSWAVTVADALRDHVAVLAAARGLHASGAPMSPPRLGASRTLATLEALLSAAGLWQRPRSQALAPAAPVRGGVRGGAPVGGGSLVLVRAPRQSQACTLLRMVPAADPASPPSGSRVQPSARSPGVSPAADFLSTGSSESETRSQAATPPSAIGPQLGTSPGLLAKRALPLSLGRHFAAPAFPASIGLRPRAADTDGILSRPPHALRHVAVDDLADATSPLHVDC